MKLANYQWLLVPALMGVATSLGGGCSLDSTGQANCKVDEQGECVDSVSATSGDCSSAGTDGTGAETSTGSSLETSSGSTTNSSTVDCSTASGTGGGDGGGGDTGSGGSSTNSSTGSGGEGGAGGEGGSGGNTSSTSSSSSSSSAGGGQGGEGGSAPFPTCDAGDGANIDRVQGQSAGGFGLYLHYADGETDFDSSSPADETFTGELLPGQAVLAGQDNLAWVSRSNNTATDVTWHIATNLPPECDGNDAETQTCLALVAKSYRCQNAPYNETDDCPAPVTFSSESAQSSYNQNFPGWRVVLLHLTCP